MQQFANNFKTYKKHLAHNIKKISKQGRDTRLNEDDKIVRLISSSAYTIGIACAAQHVKNDLLRNARLWGMPNPQEKHIKQALPMSVSSDAQNIFSAFISYNAQDTVARAYFISQMRKKGAKIKKDDMIKAIIESNNVYGIENVDSGILFDFENNNDLVKSKNTEGTEVAQAAEVTEATETNDNA